ncbi:DUF1450 domain-containing protein [Bacillus lacus]|uniref:DUF1450 domain-containing protein n=1 Tax=Metabacillus lacus TaxID=1983721 RepID=A0A7X2J282_9BACI|nr:DUF1450 domain-containing protein [Metabacillus lacus]MRX74116.1 DUF1450 domain-containing protein [Metabacillus lacus]
MGIVVVEICGAGYFNISEVEEMLESQYPEAAVISSSCLSFCGMCAKRPFAIVNGKRIFAKTAEKCLSLIKKQIETELAVYT